MKTVIWIGPERMIPGYGVGTKGEEKVLPNDMANSYVEQELAKWPTDKKAKKIEETE